MLGRLLADICNVLCLLVPGVKIHVRLTKSRDNFYIMNDTAGSTTTFRFLEAKLLVNRVKSNPNILTAKGDPSRLNFKRDELRARTFGKGTKSLTLHNAIIGHTPKRIVFTIIKDSDFLGSKDSTLYISVSTKLRTFPSTSTDVRSLTGA
jgi:hypothetical protein